MSTTLEIAKIAMPKVYVRDQVNKKHLSDLLSVVAQANGVRTWQELISKTDKPRKIVWPFPDIEVAKLPEEEKTELAAEKKSDASATVIPTFECVDGVHRLTILKELGQLETQVTIKSLADVADRFMAAFKSSSAHGLRLSKDERDAAVKTMVKTLKMKVDVVAREIGMHKASVSRIVSGKQRTGKPHKAKGKKKVKTKKGNQQANNLAISVKGYLEGLLIRVKEFRQVKSKIEAEFARQAPDRSTFMDLSKRLLEAAEFFEDAVTK